jgi:hypothetical protein
VNLNFCNGFGGNFWKSSEEFWNFQVELMRTKGLTSFLKENRSKIDTNLSPNVRIPSSPHSSVALQWSLHNPVPWCGGESPKHIHE